MSSTTPHGELLARAFRSFERAAGDLGKRQGALRSEVERLERELLDAHRRLEAVLDSLDTGVAVVSREGALLRTNQAFRRTMASSGDDGLSPAHLLDLASEGPSRGGAARVRRHGSGQERDLAVTLVPVDDEDGTRVLTVQDVTEIRRQEEEGGRRRRLEALGRMAAEIAHEVRNPLGSIRLFASMLRDDLRDAETSRDMAEQILSATAGLESTVSNLLTFAAPPCGARKRIDLVALATDACNFLAPACRLRDVRLLPPSGALPCPVHADPEGLRQVVLNLIGNALAATRAGDTIHAFVRSEGSQAVLAIEDSGRGIAPSDLPKVFDPFFSRTEGGTGLGLSIVHGIVARHDGSVGINSRPGRGTTVRVELPARTPEEDDE